MTPRRLRLGIIIGSVRHGRFGPIVARWFADVARAHGDFAVDVIDLADTPIPDAERIDGADCFIVITPEYNHSFPGPLKTAIDAFRTEWHAKPVGMVSYGGRSGGLRAVEALRPVFAELHAVTVRDAVSFHTAHDRFDADGRPTDPGAPIAAKAMLDQVAWWGEALRDAKDRRPYEH